MNLLTREVKRAGTRVELPLREFALLESLMRASGRVLSRTRICESVWDHHFDTGTNVVDVYINRLRRKIDDPYEIKLLHTVRGVGYILKAET
jgi:two-component system OmpR family response regulator